jgi:hypothetical protein
VTIEMANMSPVEHNVTIAEGSKVLGATPTFAGRQEDGHADAETRHVHVLLLGSRPPGRRHGRHADGLVKLYVCWGTFPTPRPGGHPCANAYHALKDAGHDPEVIRSYGLRAAAGRCSTRRAGAARCRS